MARAVDVSQMLTSFQAFDQLAGQTRSPEEVTSLLQRLGRAAIGLE
jgi:hypothetical protein